MSIEDIAIQIVNLTDDDFVTTEAECLNQANYHHPLKLATTATVRKIGQHNLKSLKLLKELQLHLQQAEKITSELPNG